MKFSSTLSLAALFIAGAKATDINECLAAINGEACATMYGGGVCSDVCFEEYFQAFNCAAECDSTGDNCAANGDLEAWLGIADPTDMLELFYKPYMCESPCPVEAIDAYYNCQFVYDWNLGSCAGCDEYYAPLPTMDGFEDCFTAGADFFYVYIEEGMKKCPSVEAYFAEAFGGTCSYDACVDWGDYYGYSDYGGSAPEVEGGEDDGPPQCTYDCPGLENLSQDDSPEAVCTWIGGMEASGCLSDCDDDTLGMFAYMTPLCEDCVNGGDCDLFGEGDGGEEANAPAPVEEEEADAPVPAPVVEEADAPAPVEEEADAPAPVEEEEEDSLADALANALAGMDSPASFTTMAVGAVAFVAMLL